MLQKNAVIIWDTPQQNAFEQLKRVISSSPILSYFDASSTGLEAVVMQDGNQFHTALVHVLVQKNVMQTLKENYWLLPGARKGVQFHTYIYGRMAVVETDHKPL